MFDTVAGQTLLAASGALTARAVAGKPSLKSANICKRSLAEVPVFDSSYPPMANAALKLLPGSLSDFQLNSGAIAQPENLAMTVYTIFLVLKLISVGHPASKPYYEEICQSIWPRMTLEDCQTKLVLSGPMVYSDLETVGSFPGTLSLNRFYRK